MGSQSSTQYNFEDGQNMFFNNYPYSKSKNKPLTHRQQCLQDPTGQKEIERAKMRSEHLKRSNPFNLKVSKKKYIEDIHDNY